MYTLVISRTESCAKVSSDEPSGEDGGALQGRLEVYASLCHARGGPGSGVVSFSMADAASTLGSVSSSPTSSASSGVSSSAAAATASRPVPIDEEEPGGREAAAEEKAWMSDDAESLGGAELAEGALSVEDCKGTHYAEEQRALATLAVGARAMGAGVAALELR